MPPPLHLPLYDPAVQPSTWNERMAPGEYAVHLSGAGTETAATECLVFPSLPEAEQYAQAEVARQPTLRCRIYDHNGFIGAPIREYRGASYRGDSDISPRFRRWAGSILFFGGLALTIADWAVDFRYLWPSMLGTRMIFPGGILLLIEAVITLNARRHANAQRESHTIAQTESRTESRHRA